MLFIRHSAISTMGVAVLALLLSACTNLQKSYTFPKAPPEWEARLETVSAITIWTLEGRLNIRQGNQSDTLNLNWAQQQRTFDINISGTLGLGAVHLWGTPELAILEKAGEEPRSLFSLDELTREILGYPFPARHLLWWVRGLPTPDWQAEGGWNQAGELALLLQTDNAGREWILEFDRYSPVDNIPLPGRIRIKQGDLQMTFLINSWQLPETAP